MEDCCRICETNDNLQLIFERGNEEILRMLRSIATSPINVNDCRPQHICLQCRDDLQKTYSFKLRFAVSNSKMKNIFLSPERPVGVFLSNIGEANVSRKSTDSENIHSKKYVKAKKSTSRGCVPEAEEKMIEDETYSRYNRGDKLTRFQNNPEDQGKSSIASSAVSGSNAEIAEIIVQKHENLSLCNNQLKILLQSWKQEHLLNTLIAENVNINILKIMKIRHIERLLKDFKLGDQILFEYNLELWRKEIGLPLHASRAIEHHSVSSVAATNLLEKRLQRSSPYLVPSTSSSRTSSPEPNSSSRITLSNILNKTHKGQVIAGFYDKNKRLKDEHRVALINLIASYFEENHYHLSLRTSYRLEKEILEHFPSEKQELYRTGKRGKIYARYCNTKRIIKKLHPVKALTEKGSGSQKMNKLCPEPDAELCIKILRCDNLSVQEFDSVWQSCRNFRLNEIQTMSCLTEVLSKWPEYKKSSGYRLIDLDFKGLHPDSFSIFLGWEEESVKIKSFLLEKVHDKGILSALSGLDHTEYDDNYFVLELLRSVHGFLIPTQRIPKTDNVGKKFLYKPTIRDSQNAFVFVGQSVQEVEEHIQFLSKQSASIQPLLLVVCNNSYKKIENIILLIDEIKLVFNSFLRAVDICFKSFFVFNISYPTACEQFWTFLEKYFYKADISDCKKSSKVVHMIEALLGTI